MNTTRDAAGEANEKIAQFIDRLVYGRDPDLAAHHKRSRESSVAVCRHIGCTPEEIEIMAIASCVHDVGKMSINEHILNKPARLTEAEYELVKQHTVLGGRLIDPLKLDPRVRDVIVSHHENFDGSGYPNGLQGEGIPFLARIMRITDSYDALTSDRPYHKGILPEEAIKLMCRDSHIYDPYLVESFIKAAPRP